MAMAIDATNQPTASGAVAPSKTVVARRRPGRRRLLARVAAAPANSTHCPIPPATIHECAAAQRIHPSRPLALPDLTGAHAHSIAPPPDGMAGLGWEPAGDHSGPTRQYQA